MITVFTVAFNEELQLPYLIDHYRSRFENCKIVVYDNMSTDNTINIAKKNNCEVIQFDTNNTFNDKEHINIKNNCWKTSQTDWILICDTDELLDITQEQLKLEENAGTSIIKSEGYNMINMEDNLNISNIRYGVRAPRYDKTYLFSKKYIKEINYEVGCHECNPNGYILYSNNAYKAYHFNFINLHLSLEKYKTYAARLSKENIENKWGYHYLFPEEKIKEEFNELRKNAIKLI